MNLKRDYVCVANLDPFELTLLINDADSVPTKPSEENKNEEFELKERKLPLFDVKLGSNLIQLRTCQDSAFALIELINYIVTDGDLHELNTQQSIQTRIKPQQIQTQTLAEVSNKNEDTNTNVMIELDNAIKSDLNLNNSKTVSNSIPINHQNFK